MKNKKYVIMCVGLTHSGKTTFAKKLAQKHKNLVLLDSDEVASFTKETYPLVVNSAFNKNLPYLENLKTVIFKDIYRFCLRTGFNLILSNGNLANETRSFAIREAKKHHYQIITVYFNVPREIILKRIQNTKKSKKVFVQSKSWPEVLVRQEKLAELPPSKKNTIYFEIKNNTDSQAVFKELNKLVVK